MASVGGHVHRIGPDRAFGPRPVGSILNFSHLKCATHRRCRRSHRRMPYGLCTKSRRSHDSRPRRQHIPWDVSTAMHFGRTPMIFSSSIRNRRCLLFVSDCHLIEINLSRSMKKMTRSPYSLRYRSVCFWRTQPAWCDETRKMAGVCGEKKHQNGIFNVHFSIELHSPIRRDFP